jgi:UDP-N-acetylbacillosamine N-acetyltransferase
VDRAGPGIVIWGTSGHARVVADILRQTNAYRIHGFLDNVNPGLRGSSFLGAPVLGGTEALDTLLAIGVRHLILAFGDCRARLRLSAQIQRSGFELGEAIHPRAVIASDVQVAPGAVIAAGAVVNPGSILGESVIINTLASVDHECVIGNGAHISPGVNLAGRVTVGMGTWIGIGAKIIDGIKVGNGAMIGAGAVVTSDIPDHVLAFGVPARVIRKLVAHEE